MQMATVHLLTVVMLVASVPATMGIFASSPFPVPRAIVSLHIGRDRKGTTIGCQLYGLQYMRTEPLLPPASMPDHVTCYVAHRGTSSTVMGCAWNGKSHDIDVTFVTTLLSQARQWVLSFGVIGPLFIDAIVIVFAAGIVRRLMFTWALTLAVLGALLVMIQ